MPRRTAVPLFGTLTSALLSFIDSSTALEGIIEIASILMVFPIAGGSSAIIYSFYEDITDKVTTQPPASRDIFAEVIRPPGPAKFIGDNVAYTVEVHQAPKAQPFWLKMYAQGTGVPFALQAAAVIDIVRE